MVEKFNWLHCAQLSGTSHTRRVTAADCARAQEDRPANGGFRGLLFFIVAVSAKRNCSVASFPVSKSAEIMTIAANIVQSGRCCALSSTFLRYTGSSEADPRDYYARCLEIRPDAELQGTGD